MTDEERRPNDDLDDLDDELTVEGDDEVLARIRAELAAGRGPAMSKSVTSDPAEEMPSGDVRPGEVASGEVSSPAPASSPSPPPVDDLDDETIAAPPDLLPGASNPFFGAAGDRTTGEEPLTSPGPVPPPPTPPRAPTGRARPPIEPAEPDAPSSAPGGWAPPSRARRTEPGTRSEQPERRRPVWLVPALAAFIVVALIVALVALP